MVVVPPCPGEGYVWVDGFWNLWGGRYRWSPGYWRAPAYYGYRGGYYRGYDHRWAEYGHGWDRGRHEGWDRHEFRHEDGRGRYDGRGWGR